VALNPRQNRKAGEWIARRLADPTYAPLRQEVLLPGPLPRTYGVRTGGWSRWLGGEGRFRGQLVPTGKWKRVALATLSSLPLALNDPEKVLVGREELLTASVACQATMDNDGFPFDVCLVKLWVLMSIWGGGDSGRRHWNTAIGLNDPELLPCLRNSFRQVQSGDIRVAYDTCRKTHKVSGTARSFFTKWLWLASLSAPHKLDPSPLILDARVATSLRDIGFWDWVRNRTAADKYLEYCAGAANWAATVRAPPTTPALDAEKIEYILFQR
jgi:hypothetical protein